MGAIGFLKKQPPPVIVLLGFLLVAVLGFADYITGPELFFLEFYLIPVLLVAWFVGERAALGISIASAVCWFIDEVVERPPHQQPAVVYLNVGTKLFVFILFTHMVLAFKKALEREKIAEKERIDREIEIAKQVQERLLPQSVPPMKTLDYVGICKPVFGVGGDYFDFLQLEQDHVAIAVGDVSGKGISSALLMASFQGMLHSHTLHRPNELAELIGDLNRIMFAFTDRKRFVSFFYAVYDDKSRRLNYVNAGHNPPMIFRKNSSNGPIKLDSTGVVIGLFPNASYTEQSLQLCEGDILVCFTDGITEAMNLNEEEYTEERLIEVISQNQEKSACDLRDLILDHVHTFSGEAPQRDDETLVVVRVL